MTDALLRPFQIAFAAVWAAFTFALYVAVLVVVPILLLTTSCKAQDQDTRWALREFRRCEHRAWDGSCTWYSRGHYFWSPTYRTYRREHPRNHTYHLPETRVYGYRRDRDGEEYGGGVECKGSLRATGDDKLQQDNAEVSAQERWALQVESRIGGIYSDIRYAANIRTTCVKRVPGTLSERGQAALGVRHFLCEVEARPCRAPAIRQDEDSRAKRRSERVEEDTRPARRDR